MNIWNTCYLPHTAPCAERTVLNKTTRCLHAAAVEVKEKYSLTGKIPCDLIINGSHVNWDKSTPDLDMSGFGCFFESQRTQGEHQAIQGTGLISHRPGSHGLFHMERKERGSKMRRREDYSGAQHG